MKLTKREQLERKLARAIKAKNKAQAAWTLVELLRLENTVEKSQDELMAEVVSAVILKRKEELDNQVKETEIVDCIPENLVVKRITSEFHVTDTEKRTIKRGLALKAIEFSTRIKHYKVIGKKDNYLLIDIHTKATDFFGKKALRFERVKVEYILT